MSQTASAPLSKALVSFDSLPNSAHVDVRTVAGLYGCSVPTVWRRVAAGLIPAAKKFGHSSRWHVGELRTNLVPEAA
ncbi:helix-turn-helix transcriptional regulator [Burkholderia pseudomallei]|uniref:helix-turn-helix transcriptional regulator n=1 Tax=Burkholderia pseudomallei TaxID=28450 RepID=UPI0021F70902|nr:helix-turn-helix domain-containing protein [Burkholderia pseudomallei]MCV9985492.1 helix-turn-helix domain-containing protein [Burkholderia pseudomallei]MCV9991726.1 helix-turn-helix domain-containing protein [Burkholderia pseudomallei]MCW0149943.1 helix-turn-helix domain-containing protein [Burkholderia pseudomallei]